MKPCWFSFLVLTGVAQLVQSAPRKYFLIQENKTWSDAQAYCRSVHTDLVSVSTEEDLIQIHNETQRWQFNSNAWIGLYKDMSQHEWRWSLDQQKIGGGTKWSSSTSDSNCCGAVIFGSWNKISCSLSRPFMCYDDTRSGTDQYIYYSTAMMWRDAQSYCRQHHTDLCSSRDDPEFSIIQQKIPNPFLYCWIGLYRDIWVWSDQSNITFIQWIAGQPNSLSDAKNCAYVLNSQAGDEQCSKAMPFLCYSEITGQQRFIRLKVQSDQDVSSLTVNEGILEKMYQKLMEHGVNVNVTVKWRKQSDGEVFNKLD